MNSIHTNCLNLTRKRDFNLFKGPNGWDCIFLRIPDHQVFLSWTWLHSNNAGCTWYSTQVTSFPQFVELWGLVPRFYIIEDLRFARFARRHFHMLGTCLNLDSPPPWGQRPHRIQASLGILRNQPIPSQGLDPTTRQDSPPGYDFSYLLLLRIIQKYPGFLTFFGFDLIWRCNRHRHHGKTKHGKTHGPIRTNVFQCVSMVRCKPFLYEFFLPPLNKNLATLRNHLSPKYNQI